MPCTATDVLDTHTTHVLYVTLNMIKRWEIKSIPCLTNSIEYLTGSKACARRRCVHIVRVLAHTSYATVSISSCFDFFLHIKS